MWDAGCGMQDAGCGMQDVGCGMRDVEGGIQDVGCRIRDVGCGRAGGEVLSLAVLWGPGQSGSDAFASLCCSTSTIVEISKY